ncbi:MAG: MerR family transcriptional regulator [Actinobacteria bacterium]|nr:MerR family transcriptional regulator [Actinomycetota bacterium]
MKKYTIKEISNLTGFSRRTIRYYVQKKIIEPPSGRGRGGFYYNSHLSDLLKIRSLQEKGLNLSVIKDIVKGTVLAVKGDSQKYIRDLRVRYKIIPGFEINISRSLEEKKSKKILEIIRLIKSNF